MLINAKRTTCQYVRSRDVEFPILALYIFLSWNN